MSMKSLASKMGIGPKHHKPTVKKPVYIDPAQFKTVREDIRFKKAQAALDEAGRVVHQAKNEKELRKALRLLMVAQKTFDAAFLAHRKV
jgi:hypothetical protein